LLLWSTLGASLSGVAVAFVGQSTWWLGGVLIFISTVSYSISLTFLYAYLPEVSEEENVRSKVSSKAIVGANVADLLFGVIAVGLLLGLQTGGVTLKYGDFESTAEYWNVRSDPFGSNFSNSSVTCESSTSATSSACFRVNKNAYQGNFFLEVNSANLDSANSSLVGLYQENTFDSSSKMSDRDILFSAYVKVPADFSDSEISGNCYVQVWENDIATASTKFDLPSTRDYAFFPLKYTTNSSTTNLVFEVVVPGASNVTGIDQISVTTYQDQLSSFIVSGAGLWFLIFGVISMMHFGHRDANPALAALTGWQKFTSGFRGFARNLKTIAVSYPRVGVFQLAIAFYSAGAAAVVSISSTFFVEQLQVSGSIVTLSFLLAQFAGIAGAFAWYKIGARLGFNISLLMVYVMFGLVVILAAGVMTAPSRKNWIWPVALLAGVALAGGISLSRTAFSSMIPIGREAEFFGVFNFSGAILSWLGTLLVGVINDATGNLRTAYFSISALFALAALLQILVIFWPGDRSVIRAVVEAPLPDAPSELDEVEKTDIELSHHNKNEVPSEAQEEDIQAVA
jgi:MFS-type transporter involved in bile tolerance (Atg22 family)